MQRSNHPIQSFVVFGGMVIAVAMAGCSSTNGRSVRAAEGGQDASVPAGPPSEAPAPAKPQREDPGSAVVERDASDSGSGAGPMFPTSCPVAIDGVTAEVLDTQGGVALVFTTPTGDGDDLRRRVEEMARMYRERVEHRGWRWHRIEGRGAGRGRMDGPRSGSGAGRGAGPAAGRGPGPAAGGGLGPMPQADIATEPLDQGARIVMTPKDPARLEDLRIHVRAHRDRMMSNECPVRADSPPTDTPSDPPSN